MNLSQRLSSSSFNCLSPGGYPFSATVQVLAGRGALTISGQHISLEPGVFVVMPASEAHALHASENLAFLLTFSATAP